MSELERTVAGFGPLLTWVRANDSVDSFYLEDEVCLANVMNTEAVEQRGHRPWWRVYDRKGDVVAEGDEYGESGKSSAMRVLLDGECRERTRVINHITALIDSLESDSESYAFSDIRYERNAAKVSVLRDVLKTYLDKSS